ncbi:MAG: hypothetical protein OEY03_07400 [Rhizobacter sp.]|nr:hypothetical protein [Rhizobacter sp.]
MSERNGMMRRLLIDAIRNDAVCVGGNYTRQSRMLQFASFFFAIGTNGGNQAPFKAPTRERADAVIDQQLKSNLPALPATTSTSGTCRATTTPRTASSASRRRRWRSTRPTTSAIRPKSVYSIARSSAVTAGARHHRTGEVPKG